jgi:hypothetical protein
VDSADEAHAALEGVVLRDEGGVGRCRVGGGGARHSVTVVATPVSVKNERNKSCYAKSYAS